jgi:hypothetical protein
MRLLRIMPPGTSKLIFTVGDGIETSLPLEISVIDRTCSGRDERTVSRYQLVSRPGGQLALDRLDKKTTKRKPRKQ